MTDLERIEAKVDDLLRMQREIYAHLGLDARKIVSMRSVKEQARKDVLKWQEKHGMKRNDRETS